jgi:hypothetical protein
MRVVMTILVHLLCDPPRFIVAHFGHIECVLCAQCSRSMSQNCRRMGEIWAVEILGSDHEAGQNMELTVSDPKPIELHGFRALVQLI